MVKDYTAAFLVAGTLAILAALMASRTSRGPLLAPASAAGPQF